MVCETLSQKKPITKKKAGGVALGVGPEFKPQCHKKDKHDKKNIFICEGNLMIQIQNTKHKYRWTWNVPTVAL
jgi:hypothetical protein